MKLAMMLGLVMTVGITVLSPVANAEGTPSDQAIASFCEMNPALSPDIVRPMVQQVMSGQHDPALDNFTDNELVERTIGDGVTMCAERLQANPSAYFAISSAGNTDDQAMAWSAFNVTCAKETEGLAACITSETKAAAEVRAVAQADQPPGAARVVGFCTVALHDDFTNAEWAECLHVAMKSKITQDGINNCAVSLPFHGSEDGAAAGRAIASCLLGN